MPPTLIRSPVFGESLFDEMMDSSEEPTFTLVVLPLSLMSTGRVFQAKTAAATMTTTTTAPMMVVIPGAAGPLRREERPGCCPRCLDIGA